MSVIPNLEDSGKGEEPFFQPGLRVFSHSAFLRREYYLITSVLSRSPLQRKLLRSFLDPFILLYGKAVKMQIWQGGD